MFAWSEIAGGFWMGSEFAHLYKSLKQWSWRRDLNPRPSDYKSDALPTELRQHSEATIFSTVANSVTPSPRFPKPSSSDKDANAPARACRRRG